MPPEPYNAATTTNEPQASTGRFPVFRQLLLLALVLGLIFGGAYLPQVIADKDKGEETNVATPIEPLKETALEPVTLEPLPEELGLEAKAAYVWDVQQQRLLFSKNPDEALPLASVTKLMTALLAYELVSDDETLTITDNAIHQEGDSGLLGGEAFALSTLSDFALLTSSNDAAFALANTAGSLLSKADPDQAFVSGMNVRAEELGLSKTAFLNPTGLDIDETTPGAVGSARDVTYLMEHILQEYPQILEATQRPTGLHFNEDGGFHEGANTNLLASDIPNVIGSKTGYTDLAGGNLVVAYDAGLNRPIIVTVLGSSWNGRFVDVMTLVEAVGANFVTEK